MAVIPKLPFPVVQLEAPPLTPAGFAVSLLVPSGFAAEEYAVASALEEVVLVLSGVPVCRICACVGAIPAQVKTIAARMAIEVAPPVLALFMV